MSDKKITPREAAVAVLKKAEELYRASIIAKGNLPKIAKSEEEMGADPDAQADAALGEKVEQEAKDVGQEAPMKGHIKLAKFVGRMEHKKGQKELAKAGPMSESIGKPKAGSDMKAGSPSKGLMGTSEIGASVRGEDGAPNMDRAKKEAAKSLNVQQNMPKPKLPG